MKKFLLPFLLLPLTKLAANPIPDFPFIAAHAETSIEVSPNQAKITFTVLVHDLKASEATLKLEEILKKTIASVIKLGVKKEEISAFDLKKNEVRKKVEDYKKLEIIGYDLKRGVTVTVSDIKKYPEIATLLYATDGVTNINSTFESSAEAENNLTLLTSACKKARNKGERLATAAGVKIKGVHAVSDQGWYSLHTKFGLGSEWASLEVSSGGDLLPESEGSSKKPTILIPKFIRYSVSVDMLFRLED